MDAESKAALEQIGREAADLVDEVESALDEYATHAQRLETRARVDAVARHYRDLVAAMGEADQMTADRTVGRKVRDVQKSAASLPAAPAGNPAEKPADLSFFATRAPLSSRPPVQPGEGALPKGTPKVRVTAEVEAWCGACAQMRTHVIAAMMGDQPAQVVCQVCGGRHKYRTGPARPRKDEATPASLPRRQTAGEMESDRKARERAALIDELRAAESVRAYSPRDRYKVGEIISHPEHGRGKIENTLPRSMLVRFAGGLRSLKLGI